MLDDVRPLVEAGFAVHLLHPRSKRPVGEQWSSAPVASFHSIERGYERGHNIGVRLGKPSRVEGRYLYVIDLDIRLAGVAEEARRALAKLFPKVRFQRFPCVRTGSGGESVHYYFICSDMFPSKKLAHSERKFRGSDGAEHWEWEIELFGSGKQVALPPSIHPDSGKPYRWEVEPDLIIGFPEIPAEVIGDLIFSPEETDRDPDSLEPLDMTDDEIWDVLDDIQGDADDHETWRNVGMALKHELGDAGWPIFDAWSKRGRGYNARDNRAQWKAFKNNRSNPITMRSMVVRAKDFRIRETFAEIDREPEPDRLDENDKPILPKKTDPDLSMLRESRVEPPAFPVEIFGSKWAKRITKLAASVGAPVDFVGGSILAGASAMIGNSVLVEVRKGFTQPIIVWTQIIGLPSANKSPALRIVTRAVKEIENRYEPLYNAQMKVWKRKAELADMRKKQWDAKIKGMLADGKDVPETEPDDCSPPPQPVKRMTSVNDVTIEAFMREQARNPRGFMVFRDELAGWLGNMEKYSNDSERGAWLESYDGGPYSIVRVKDEGKVITVHAMNAPVMGGIQPDRLADITSVTATDDGLQARFMPYWPEESFRPMAAEPEPSDWLVEAYQQLSELSLEVNAHGAPEARILPFTAESFDAFRQWSDARKKAERHVPTRLANVYGKAEGMVARMAGLLELLWWALDNDFEDADPPRKISLKAVSAAISYRETYLKQMQQRVFSHASEPEEVANARLIAKWIVTNKVDVLNLRDLRREAGVKGEGRKITARTAPEVIDAAIGVLIGMRWITEEEVGERKRGRPAKNYAVNPRIWELVDR